MDFYTTRDLRTTPKELWDSIKNDGMVTITNKGKPAAIMVDVSDNDLLETIEAISKAKALMNFNSLRDERITKGYMSEEEINEEIKAYRDGK